MAAATEPDAEALPKKSSKLPLIVGLVLAVAGSAGGFTAVSFGLFGPERAADSLIPEAREPVEAMAPTAFVALDPMVINLPPGSERQFLRFAAQLEVVPAYRSEVESMTPRVVDVLNGYLRAVEPTDLESPSALNRLRAQMLRRIQVVVGEGRVRDLLIMEFVLN